MTKRETRKAAYRLIVNEKKSHQQTFDELRGNTEMEISSLAKTVGTIPSLEKRRKNKTLVIVYVVLLGLVIITRSMGILGLSMMGGMNSPVLLLLLALGLVVPGIAIFGALTSRVEIYYSTAGLLAYSIFRAFTKDAMFFQDVFSLIFIIPTVLVIALAVIIPFRLKTPYTERKVVEENDGHKTVRIMIEFEQSENNNLNPDILDA